MSSRFEFVTALSIEECVSRLVSATDHESFDLSRLHLSDNVKPVSGEARENGFLLRNRMVMGYNSFQTFASGSLRASEDGTAIEGYFSAHPGFKLGRRAWGCMITFIGLPTLLSLLSMILSGEVNWRTVSTWTVSSRLTVLVALVAPALVYAFGRLGASEEAEKLRRFLLVTLEAHQA